MREPAALHRLLYVSLSTVAPDDPEIDAIARVSLSRNSAAGVTGFLYHDDHVFLQALEGAEPDVAAIYASIRRDGRHQQVRTLMERAVDSRYFGGWAMGFYDGSAEQDLPGLGGPGFHARAQEADPGDLVQLLRQLTLDFRHVRLIAEGP